MKYLKRYNESTESTKLLSVDEIEDYFLEFIDNGSMEFDYSGIPFISDANKVIETTFKINVRNMNTIEELTNFSNLITQIRNVVRRWNLDFKFSTIAISYKPGGGGRHQTQLSIIQPVPKVIIDNYYTQLTPNHRLELDGLKIRYTRYLEVNNDMDFLLKVEITPWDGGSGQNGRWLKSDYKKFSDNESEFIKHITDNKDLPCKFISKKPASDLRYARPFYKDWIFKLLI